MLLSNKIEAIKVQTASERLEEEKERVSAVTTSCESELDVCQRTTVSLEEAVERIDTMSREFREKQDQFNSVLPEAQKGGFSEPQQRVRSGTNLSRERQH